MIFRETTLEGAFIIDPEPVIDNRGLFARIYCKEEFLSINHQKEFVQFNHSINNRKGTLRGMHFQLPPHDEIKLIRCIKGRIYDVIVDLRRGSPRFLQYFGVELSAENMKMIYVPAGFAHGFQTLEDNTELIYHHTAFYKPEAEGGLRFDDPRVGIRWPLPPTMISSKDQGYAFLPSDYSGIVVEKINQF